MFIFWGSRKTEKKEGYVAEFCPVCRAIKPFQLSRVGVSDHLYGVSLGQAKVLGHAGICQECGIRIGVDAVGYTAFAKYPGTDVEALIRQTFPRIREARAPRLALEDQVRTGTLAPADRETLLMEPFHLFSDLTEANFAGSIHIQGKGGWGCLGTFVVAFAVLLICNAIWVLPEQRDSIMGIFFGILVIGGLYSFVQLLLEPGRIFSRKIIPGLAKALAPLKPTKEELASCIERFKRSGFKIGKKTKLDVLWKAIQPPDPASFVAPDFRK